MLHLTRVCVTTASMRRYLYPTEVALFNSIRMAQQTCHCRKICSLVSMEEIQGDQYLLLCAKRNRIRTAKAPQSDLQLATGMNVSDQTIKNRLDEGGLRARHPLMAPMVTAWHCGALLIFAIKHNNWQGQHWFDTDLV